MTTKYNWKNIKTVDEIPAEKTTRQIYVWIITKDQKVIIVSKDGKNWQFPGGKPKEDETIKDTILREIQEETGVDVTDQYADVTPFGYYIVTQEENAQQVEFLQLRFFIFLKEKSGKINLKPVENPEDPDPINYIKVVGLNEIEEFIPWLNEVGEYQDIKNIVNA